MWRETVNSILTALMAVSPATAALMAASPATAALMAASPGTTDQPMTSEIQPAARPDSETDRFAMLALDCVHREYPNKISHVLEGDDDARAPRALYPAFYGCYDWHSSVHGHWLLARIARTDPDTPLRDPIMAALGRSLTAGHIAGEVAYLTAEGRASFERPYGIAWFMQLVSELDESDEPMMREWRENLRPLESAIIANVMDWLPKLAYPIRSGTHNQSAFAFGLMLDYARQVENEALADMIIAKSLEFHEGDVDCPLGYEPSGEDFLSPCLMEADLMRRVLPSDRFAEWLSAFLPQIPRDGTADWLEPGIVLDPEDGKLVHLDGVNLSRGWALEGIASALPDSDARIAALRASADLHRKTGLAAVSDENYEGSHWLGSFATYLITRRGIGEGGARQGGGGS